MQYHDQPIQYISNHYFQVKSKDDAKYETVLYMMRALTYLPSTLMPVISFLIIAYVYPLISYYVKRYSEKIEKDQFIYTKQLTHAEIELMQEKFIQKWKSFHLIRLFLTSFVINIVLVILHVLSAAKFIEYGNEILHDEEFLMVPVVIIICHTCMQYFHASSSLPCLLLQLGTVCTNGQKIV